MKHTVTIRLGAANWDATIATAAGPVRFDLRDLYRNRKLGPWYGKFMGAVRQTYGVAAR